MGTPFLEFSDDLGFRRPVLGAARAVPSCRLRDVPESMFLYLHADAHQRAFAVLDVEIASDCHGAHYWPVSLRWAAMALRIFFIMSPKIISAERRSERPIIVASAAAVALNERARPRVPTRPGACNAVGSGAA